MNNNDILQFSMDIEDTNEFDAYKLTSILESVGITVLGCQWKATWTNEGYEKGEAPISSD